MAQITSSLARSIILCTQNVQLELQMALKARSMKPDIEVVIRIFDDDFAGSLLWQFGFRALSATGMAAPVFASSASSIDITAPITIEGEPNSLTRFHIAKKSRHTKFSPIRALENFYWRYAGYSRRTTRHQQTGK